MQRCILPQQATGSPVVQKSFQKNNAAGAVVHLTPADGSNAMF